MRHSLFVKNFINPLSNLEHAWYTDRKITSSYKFSFVYVSFKVDFYGQVLLTFIIKISLIID